MNITTFESLAYIHPGNPLDFVATVDGRPMHISIEWATLLRVMGVRFPEERVIREFLHRKRHQLALAIQARVLARGAPLDHHIVMSWQDLATVDAIQIDDVLKLKVPHEHESVPAAPSRRYASKRMR